MNSLSEVPAKDHEHYTKCPTCENYFDMRDLQQVVDHQHWLEAPTATFSHSTKWGKHGEVYINGKRGMVTLKEEKQRVQFNKLPET
jgi:uncharacterized C2H2 Zn-finger protein